MKQNEVFENLKSLAGVWYGEGTAKYPTIETAEYLEILTIKTNNFEPALHYEQQTWYKLQSGEKGEPLHWESGFIRVLENGELELLNAQNSGRVEVLHGRFADSSQKLTLSFESVLIGHDKRLISTARRFQVEGNKLRYVVEMATRKAPKQQIHLEAILEKDLK